MFSTLIPSSINEHGFLNKERDYNWKSIAKGEKPGHFGDGGSLVITLIGQGVSGTRAFHSLTSRFAGGIIWSIPDKEDDAKRTFCFALAAICILTCWAAACRAGFSLPPEVYRIGSLKEVQDRAKSANVPIVFIYSNENSACGLAKTATLDVVQELKGAAFIIYVSKNDSASIPRDVIKAMNSPAAGKFIPKSIVIDPKTNRIEMIIPYISDRGRRIEEIRKVRSLRGR